VQIEVAHKSGDSTVFDRDSMVPKINKDSLSVTRMTMDNRNLSQLTAEAKVSNYKKPDLKAKLGKTTVAI
jgi:hypothetical protein